MGLSTKQTINYSNTTTDVAISQAQRQDDDEDEDDRRDDAAAAKLVNLEDEEEGRVDELAIDGEEEEGEGDDEHCVICLHEIRDRTILPCAHDRLCFECIFVWCQQSRKCPLCNAPIGPYLIHNFRSDYDYSKHYLQPLRLSPVPPNNNVLVPSRRTTARPSRNREQVSWGRRRNAQTSQERKDELELAISKRRWIYRHGLYAKHVASNSHTRYRPAPTPAQFSNSQDAISRATIFIRRELRVWINLDVEFLTTFILSLMKSIDIRSESAVKLLAEFLDMDISYHVGETDGPSRGRFPNAEHFAHELYSYLRSPFKDLTIYDRAVQYEIPLGIPPPPDRPIPKRYERHWEITTHDDAPAAESSRHALHLYRRNSHSHSPSPHLRSEEEEEPVQQRYSPSQSSSPSNSYDNFYRYRSSRVPSPGGSTDRPRNGPGPSYSSFGKRRVDDGERENNKNEKGKKGKTREIIPSKKENKHDSGSDMRGGTWKSNSKNIRVERASRKRERSVSSEEYSTRKRLSPVRNVGRSGYEPSQRQQRQNDSTFAIPPDSPEHGTGTSKQMLVSKVEIPAPHPSTIITDQQPEIPVHPNWGISIKGQAKLQLGGEGDQVKRNNDIQTQQPSSGPSRVLLSVDDDVSNLNPNDTIPKNRLRKPSELLHAHLLRNSSGIKRTINEVDASNPGGSSSSGSGTSSATVQNNLNNNTEMGINLKEENERRISSSSSSRDLEIVAPQGETPNSGLPTTTRMSARDIMIRTRARLAKMRNEQDSDLPTAAVAVMGEGSVDCGVLDNSISTPPPQPPSDTTSSELRPAAATVSLSATVRAHLLKQLEVEKRKLNGRNSGKDNDGSTSSATRDERRRSFDAGAGGGMDEVKTASDGHTGGGISIGKDHQDLITKEEILRTRLLLRKSETREGSAVSRR